MPGKTIQRIPAEGRVETIVYPWVFFPHQHLYEKGKFKLTHLVLPPFQKACSERLCSCSYHDEQGDVCRPQSFETFRPIGGPPVVERGAGDIEPAWRVNVQLPIDEVLIAFTLQCWGAVT